MPTIKNLVESLIEIEGNLKGLEGVELGHYIKKQEAKYADLSLDYKVLRKQELIIPNFLKEIQRKRIKDYKRPINLMSFGGLERMVLDFACTVHEVDLEMFISHSRKREIIDLKQQLQTIYYIYFNKGFSLIGTMFNVDHSTVIHSVKAHEDKIVSDRIYKDMYSRIVQFTKEILDQNIIKIDSDISLESAVKVRVAKKAINKQRKNKQQEVR